MSVQLRTVPVEEYKNYFVSFYCPRCGNVPDVDEPTVVRCSCGIEKEYLQMPTREYREAEEKRKQQDEAIEKVLKWAASYAVEYSFLDGVDAAIVDIAREAIDDRLDGQW